MRCHWKLPIRSLFVISDTPQRSSTEMGAEGNQHWAYSDMPLPPCTLCLLQALGESCSNACIAVCEIRMKALPLLSQQIENNGTAVKIRGRCAVLSHFMVRSD